MNTAPPQESLDEIEIDCEIDGENKARLHPAAIQARVGDLAECLEAAHARQDWQAIGFNSWQDYASSFRLTGREAELLMSLIRGSGQIELVVTANPVPPRGRGCGRAEEELQKLRYWNACVEAEA